MVDFLLKLCCLSAGACSDPDGSRSHVLPSNILQLIQASVVCVLSGGRSLHPLDTVSSGLEDTQALTLILPTQHGFRCMSCLRHCPAWFPQSISHVTHRESRQPCKRANTSRTDHEAVGNPWCCTRRSAARTWYRQVLCAGTNTIWIKMLTLINDWQHVARCILTRCPLAKQQSASCVHPVCTLVCGCLMRTIMTHRPLQPTSMRVPGASSACRRTLTR